MKYEYDDKKQSLYDEFVSYLTVKMHADEFDGDDEIAVLCQALRHNTQLCYVHAMDFEDHQLTALLQALAESKSLQVLCLSNHNHRAPTQRLGHDTLRALAKLLQQEANDSVFSSTSTSLMELRLTHFDFGNVHSESDNSCGVDALLDALASNKSLVELHVVDCHVPANIRVALDNTVDNHPALKSIHSGVNDEQEADG